METQKKFILLRNNPLFKGCNDDELEAIAKDTYFRIYKKGEIFLTGYTTIHKISIVVNGGDFLRKGVQVPAAIVKGSLMGVGEIGASIVKAVKNIVHGVVEGAMESGVEQKTAVRGAVAEALYLAEELRVDIGAELLRMMDGLE